MDPDQTIGRGRGYGKLILFGEHTVVYGAPAVVAGLPRGVEATARPAESDAARLVVGDAPSFSPDADQRNTVDEAFGTIFEQFEPHLGSPAEVELDIDIPVGVGLGSSAALSAAVARSLADLAELGDVDGDALVEEAVAAGERVFHGDPSGLDQLAALNGGLHFFRSAERTETAPIESESFRVGICVAGPPASTAQMVSEVAGLRERQSELFEHLKLLVGDTARAASGAIRDGDWEHVGELMDINHGALVSLGVSTVALDRACHVARDAGALGAKLTGAGGGGCVVALLGDRRDSVLEAWRSEGFEAFDVQLGSSR